METLLHHYTTYEINKPPYDVFQSIEELDFRSNLFFSNHYNLVPAIDSTVPLQLTFYLDKSLFRRYIVIEWSTKITATFQSHSNSTRIKTSVSSSPFFYLWYAIGMIGAIVSLLKQEKRVETIISYLAVFMLFYLMDKYYRKRIRKSFEAMLHDAKIRIHTIY
jgi:hypothetical protein